MKSLSCVRLFVIPWTVAHQASPSIEFSSQEYWSGLPFPSSGDLSDPGIKPGSPTLQQTLYHLSHCCFPSPEYLPNPGIKPESLALQVDSLPTELLGKPWNYQFVSVLIKHMDFLKSKKQDCFERNLIHGEDISEGK